MGELFPRKWAWVAAAAWLGLGLASGAARAQSAQDLAALPLATLLDMEVTGPSRFPTRRSESAAAVTVITRDEILALGHRTLGEALRSVRGLTLAGDRAYDYLGVRGLLASGDYNTRVLLLVDGNRVNDSLYDQAYLGTEFPLDLSLVDRIEFVPGPGSAVYGANALFGVINVITRRVADGEHQLALGLGGHGDRRLSGHWQQSGAAGAWRLAVSRSLHKGELLADPASGEHSAPGEDAERRSAAHLRWALGPWSASLLHADRDKAVPLGVGLIVGAGGNRYRDTVQLASLQFEQALGATEQGVARLHAGRYRYLGDYHIDYPPPTLNRDIGRGRWWGLEARLTSTRLAGHRLLAGIEWQQAGELRQQNFDLAPSTDTYLDDRRRQRRLALFGEDQLKLGDHWTLHLGARVDQVQQTGMATARASSPRVALAWRPTPAWSFRLTHGESFRAPNAYEAFYEVDSTAGYLRNPGLRPEKAHGDELGAEWSPAPGWRLSASLYRNDARDLLLLGYDASIERYRFDNAGSFAARGAELELEHAGATVRWRLNLTLNQDRSVGSEAVPSLFPSRMLKGMAILPLGGGWRLGMEGQAVGRRGAAPGHALLNLTATGPLPVLGARLQLGLRNALDRMAYDPGADLLRQPLLPQPRRQWRLELAWPVAG
jgi:iron complex outermembrane receptor protein